MGEVQQVMRLRRRLPAPAARLSLMMLLAAAACGSASANDSTAELATGGLVLTRSDDIEMRSEDLFISPREVRVSYRFYNTAPTDLTTLVAFPMPDITVADVGTDIPLPTRDPHNLLGFSTSVDGAPVKARVVQKVLARGVDRTADLDRLKVPLAPHLPSTDKALGKLPRSAWDELRQLGLAEVEEYSAGRSMRKAHPSARWTLQTTYYWEQTFPAFKEISVEHRYKPSVGRSVQTLIGDPEAMQEDWYRSYARKYCVDAEFIAAVARARNAARMRYGAPFSEERIAYRLSTGASWARPIGRFRLVVDKGDPASLVSFCGEGAKQIGATRFEMRRDDFSPAEDLHVLILKPSKRR